MPSQFRMSALVSDPYDQPKKLRRPAICLATAAIMPRAKELSRRILEKKRMIDRVRYRVAFKKEQKMQGRTRVCALFGGKRRSPLQKLSIDRNFV